MARIPVVLRIPRGGPSAKVGGSWFSNARQCHGFEGFANTDHGLRQKQPYRTTKMSGDRLSHSLRAVVEGWRALRRGLDRVRLVGAFQLE